MFLTHDSVLYAEAQLVSEVRPADQHHGNGRTPDDVHLDPGLRLQTLKDDRDVKTPKHLTEVKAEVKSEFLRQENAETSSTFLLMIKS